jgi:NAD(P)-dependent dehydrogenase (short-subunit alcohol dehydrogenase family)
MMVVVNNGALLSSYGGAVGSIIRPASFVVRRRSALGGNSVIDSSFQKSVVSTTSNNLIIPIIGGKSSYCSHNRYSTFTPPPNNVYNGPAPAYPNIDITSKSKVDGSSASAARNADPNAVFVITGASRSMGLQFVKEILHRTSGKIIACVLRPGSSPALDAYLNSLTRDDRVRIDVHRLDVTNMEHIDNLVTEITNNYDGRVDGLFNVAGVLGDKVNTPGPEMNISQLDDKWLSSQMSVNAIGPLMLTSRLASLLKTRKGKSYLRTTGAKESIVVNLSARVASLDDNNGGLAWYSYRMSKAALNAGVRATSHEFKRQGTWTISLYPGMTDTDMSKPFQSPAMKDEGLIFPVEFSVGRMMDVVDGMEEGHSGGFYDWAGQAIPF